MQIQAYEADFGSIPGASRPSAKFRRQVRTRRQLKKWLARQLRAAFAAASV